ncbi:hypothetical protein NO2_0603 [Candidatus Termititenax persephonae]|uniref:Uncharacterized protein n=1 Tax=Candidatus Termititenax persephonae TaxID=2218525 RepID=A0A388TGP4_9BACT|nr:hypothetical protein NO2_0603 [Candidatus Termititenax persephonae]
MGLNFDPNILDMKSRIGHALKENNSNGKESILKINGERVPLNGSTIEDKAHEIVSHILDAFKEEGIQAVKITLETPANEADKVLLEITEGSDSISVKYSPPDMPFYSEYMYPQSGGTPEIRLVQESNPAVRTQEDLLKDFNRQCSQNGITMLDNNILDNDKFKIEIGYSDAGNYTLKFILKEGFELRDQYGKTASNIIKINFFENSQKALKITPEGNIFLSSSNEPTYIIKSPEEIQRENKFRERLQSGTDFPEGKYDLSRIMRERGGERATIQLPNNKYMSYTTDYVSGAYTITIGNDINQQGRIIPSDETRSIKIKAAELEKFPILKKLLSEISNSIQNIEDYKNKSLEFKHEKKLLDSILPNTKYEESRTQEIQRIIDSLEAKYGEKWGIRFEKNGDGNYTITFGGNTRVSPENKTILYNPNDDMLYGLQIIERGDNTLNVYTEKSGIYEVKIPTAKEIEQEKIQAAAEESIRNILKEPPKGNYEIMFSERGDITPRKLPKSEAVTVKIPNTAPEKYMTYIHFEFKDSEPFWSISMGTELDDEYGAVLVDDSPQVHIPVSELKHYPEFVSLQEAIRSVNYGPQDSKDKGSSLYYYINDGGNSISVPYPPEETP